MKPLQDLLITKVKTLVEKQKIADSIEHNASKGTLRESFLRDFIVDLVPNEYDTTTGFITSSNQNLLSPQIDLIVSEKFRTPKFLLNETCSIIPYESAILLIEVKTKITNNVIVQIEKQNAYIKKCGNPQFFRTRIIEDLQKVQQELNVKSTSAGNTFSMPSPFIVAFDSGISEKKIIEIFSKIERLLGIWIIGKSFFCPNKNKIDVDIFKGDESSFHAVDCILESITIMNQERNNYIMNWKEYLK